MTARSYTGLGSLGLCDSAMLRALIIELQRQGGYIAANIAEEIQHELTARKDRHHA